MTDAQRRKQDIAYGCFLAPGAVGLLASVASAIPMDGIAGGIGFLVLIPLALAALVAVPIGLYYSIELWKDGGLPLLSILTILMIAEFVTEAGSVDFYNATGLVYGLLVLLLEASWFLFRRWRTFPHDGTTSA